MSGGMLFYGSLSKNPQTINSLNRIYNVKELHLKPEDVIDENIYKKLKYVDEIKVGKYIIKKDKKYNAIRITEEGDSDVILNIFLNHFTNKIETIGIHSKSSPSYGTIFLQDLVEKDILNSSILKKVFKLSEEEINRAKNEWEKDKRYLKELEDAQTNPKYRHITDLPSSYSLINSTDKVSTVLQGEGVIMDLNNIKGDTKKALYTTGAGPCSVLLISVKDESGNTSRIAMAHIDSFVSLENIKFFINRTLHGIKYSKVSISIISGEKSTALRVWKAAKEFSENNENISIDVVDTDFRGDRIDSVVITSKGNMGCGKIDKEFNLPNPNLMYMERLRGGLKIRYE